MLTREDLRRARPVCETCRAYPACGSPFMAGRGNQDRPLLAIVGDFPNQYDDKAGSPFMSGAGDLVKEIIKGLGLVPNRDCWFTNAMRCKPRDMEAKDAQYKLCREFLNDELLRVRPVVIVAVGAGATLALSGKNKIKVSEERGSPRKVLIESMTGGSESMEVTVLPTISPGFVMRNASSLKFLVKDLEKALSMARNGGDIPEPPQVSYRVVATDQDRADFMEEMRKAKRYAWDTETTGLNAWADGAKIVCATFSTRPGTGWLIPLHTRERENPQTVNIKLSLDECVKLIKWVFSLKREVIGQNLKFDELFVRCTFGFKPRPVNFDCSVAYHLLYEEQSQMGGNSLKSMSWEFTDMGGYELPFLNKHPEAYKAMYDMPILDADEPETSLLHYACADVDVALQVRDALDPLLKAEDLLPTLRLEMQKLQLLCDMEFKGARIDWDYHAQLMDDFPAELERIKQRLRQFPEIREAERLIAGGEEQLGFLEPAEFNPNAPAQVQTLCMGVLRLPVIEGMKKTKKGGQSVNKDAIETWCETMDPNSPALEILQTLRLFKQMTKLFGTYVKPLRELADREGRIHCSFNICGTLTWRLSSSDPNLQNLPRADDGREAGKVGKGSVKGLFVGGEDGWWVAEADYSQIELRILGLRSQDITIIESYIAGEDLHRRMASKIFKVPFEAVTSQQRTYAKTTNFGIVYGQTEQGLSKSLGISEMEAKKFLAAFYASAEGAANWIEETRKFALEHGYVKTLFGHRRHISNVFSGDFTVREKALRQAVNAVIQGTASNMAIYSEMYLNKLLQEEGMRSYCFGQVHDSIWITGPPEERDAVVKLTRLVMENLPFDFLSGDHPDYPNVPPIVADIKIGNNLRDMKEVEREVGT